MIKNPYPGKFISIDGIDGAGKSTQLQFIEGWFENLGYKVYSGHEPTMGNTGSKVNKIIKNKKSAPTPHELQKMFIEDRKEHLEGDIMPALKSGAVYICDRYFLSTLAYGMAEGLSFDDLMADHEEILSNEFIVPDMMLVIDTPVEIALARLKSKKSEKDLEYFERKEDVMKKVSENFKSFKDKFENINFVSGYLSIPDVTNEVNEILNKKFKL
ncbi:dTMP kinase [Candidatus Azambacteria bacterium]|nr:dTMP kinase [Candidatus Azambacteria bacterium]